MARSSKFINVAILIILILIVAALALKFRSSIALPKKSNKVEDNLSNQYQLWSAQFIGSDALDGCRGSFKITGKFDALFSKEFADFLNLKSKVYSKPEATDFSSNFKTEGVENNKKTIDEKIVLASRTIAVASQSEASWVEIDGKKKIRIVVSSIDHKELMVSNCMVHRKVVPYPILSIVFTGEPKRDSRGVVNEIKGDWASVNNNVPEDHSHGEFQMALTAGVGSDNPLSPPKDLKLEFIGESARLSWSPNAAIRSYKGWVSAGVDIDTKKAVTQIVSSNFIDVSGLSKHSPYAFAVTANAGADESSLSETKIGVLGEPISATKLAAGDHHACAVLISGEVICWGQNSSGQLGDGNPSLRGIAVAVPHITNATAISAGQNFSCALLAEGHVMCWGSNENDELGFSQKQGVFGPTLVPGVENATDLYSRDHRSCATLRGGAVKCWGSNLTAAPKNEISNILRVVQSKNLACALTTKSEVWCWQTSGSESKKMATDALSVSANEQAVCLVSKKNKVKCIVNIDNSKSSEGNNSLIAAAENLKDVTGLSINNNFACAAKTDTSVLCWGDNSKGQLGVSDLLKSDAPVGAEISKNNPRGEIILGADFACSLTADGTAYCWGSNEFGQLGNGVGSFEFKPLQVLK